MFDRLRNAPKDKSAPLDRKKLEAWQKSRSASNNARNSIKGGDNNYQYSIKGGATPPRPAREPYYPPESHQNLGSNLGSNLGRPVSSIYSQPSPNAATFATQQLRVQIARHDPNEISPPSSPDVLSPRDDPNSGDVSPIDEAPDMSQFAVEPRGHPKTEPRSIPVMRRERRKDSDAAFNALRESKSRERLKQPRPHGHDVRWDPNTGEPTTNMKGRPSQINPQEFVQGLGIQSGSVSPPTTKKPQHNQNSFGDRLRRIRHPSDSSQPEPASRPEWRGASGRSALVAPVNDKKDVAPLKVPRKNTKQGGHEVRLLSPIESVGSESAHSSQAYGTNQQDIPTQSSNIAVTSSSTNPRTYPSPPLSEDNATHQSLRIPSSDKAVRRKPAAGAGHQHQPSTSSSIYSEQDPRPAQPPPNTSSDNWAQPPSRFSVTTYATSQQSSTPRGSIDQDAPPIPTPPQHYTQSSPQPGPSILDRKRPVVSGYDSVVSSRKTSPIEPVKISLDSPYYMPPGATSKPTSKLSESGDKGKTLPPAPPETLSQTQDRVAQLNAKLQALGNRRINLNTAIKQMTELMPTDNLLASEAVVRKREDEKRKVEKLRGELADVERESYELGLKLHRAYKRMDRDAEYEPTTLWVRRVTGA